MENKNQKKVIFVATVSSHIKSFHQPYLRLLKENGYKTFATAKNNLKENEKIEYCDEFREIPIERSPFNFKNLKAIKQLKALVEKEKFNIIHCHTPMGGVVARLASKNARKKFGTRVIYTAHGFHFYKGAPILNWLLFYPIEWYLAKYTDTLITINKEDYERAKKKFGKRCKDIQYVPGVGIDTKKFDINLTEEEKENLRKEIGVTKNDFILTCVARLDKNKNQGFLIKCMEELVKEHSNIHLLLAGRDELNGKYQALTKKLGLENNVHFLGNRDDVPKLLQVTDIVVSASKREGLPVNVIEAFSAGLPVVALKCRGMEELIKNGKNGFITCDRKDFIYKLNDLIYNDDKLNKIKKENLYISKTYDLSVIIVIMHKVYKL